MSEYAFTVLDVVAEPYAVSPQLTARLRIDETTGLRIHALALRCQVRIEPQRRLGRRERPFGIVARAVVPVGLDHERIAPPRHVIERIVQGTNPRIAARTGEMHQLDSGRAMRRKELAIGIEHHAWRLPRRHDHESRRRVGAFVEPHARV